MKGNTIAKGCSLGCAGLVVLAILFMVAAHFLTTPEMRREMKERAHAEYAADRAAEDEKIDAFFKSLSELRTRLPAPANIKEQAVSGFGADSLPYMAVDHAWFQQFTEHGFVPSGAGANPPPYRDQDFRNVEAEAVPAAGMPHRDNSGLLANMQELAVVPYVAVFLPVTEQWPVLSADGKSFQPGKFQGWIILVDWKTKTPLGQTRLEAVSSPEIRTFQVGVRKEMLFGAGLKTAMERDYTDHLWQAADAALARLCGHEGQGGFVEHRRYFAHGGS